MMILPKTIEQDLSVVCDKCNKVTKIKVPYVCVQHDFPCDEIYTKVGIELKNLIYACYCDGIKEKVYDEYLKMKTSFLVRH